MAFNARPSFPGGVNYGFNPSPAIFFNPMIGRSFPQQIQQQPAPTKSVPTTTVFVGNITERCSNDFMQKMLDECGKVASWKRIQGVGGKYQAFGFCDFEDPEGTLRALRILNDFQIGEKKLVVKAEDKVRADLRAWAIARRKEEGKPELKLKDHELPADEEDKNKDEEIRLQILNWIEQDHPELLTVAEGESSLKQGKGRVIDGELSDSEKKAKKKDDKRKEATRKDRRKRSRSSSRSRKERNNRRRTRSPRRKRRRSYSSSSDSHSSGSYSSNSSRSRSRSSTPKHSKKGGRRSGSRETDSDAEEKRALKRALKMKEKAYQERLSKWEAREKDKARYYDKIERKEKDKKILIIKESKKLKSFLEDYNDEVDDQKYFRYSELFQRRRDFEKEKQQDAKDKLAELQEIEALKKEITEQGKYTSAEDIERVARERHRRQEEAALRKARGESGSPNPHQRLGRVNGAGDYSSSSSAESEDEKRSQTVSPNSASLGFITTTTVEPANWTVTTTEEATSTPPVKESNGGVALPAVKAAPLIKLDTKPAKLNAVFGMEDEEDVDLLRTRKQLKPFEITMEERMENITDIEKQKMVKDIIAKIPMVKEDLFQYEITWDVVNDEFINARIKPWVSKKVAEYLGAIGEEEKSLCDFICDKVKDRVEAQTIIRDVKQILDDDAEMFVIKLWRLIIFETASKKLGLKSEMPKKK